jgi:hypothetical protein
MTECLGCMLFMITVVEYTLKSEMVGSFGSPECFLIEWVAAYGKSTKSRAGQGSLIACPFASTAELFCIHCHQPI